MSEHHKPSGFSFELSESAPPVEADERTPLGDLELDMAALGASDSPFSPLPPLPRAETSEPVDAAGASERTAVAETSELRDAARLSQRTAMAATSEPQDAARLSQRTAVAATSESQDAARPGERKPLIKKIQFPARVSASALQSPARPAHNDTAPVIKKLSLPAHAAMSKARKSRSESAPASKTRFAPSISSRPIQPDSDPPPPRHGSSDDEQRSLLPELSEPCDLPASDAPVSSSLDGWGSEPPTARELWQNARKAWNHTRDGALSFGERGLRAGARAAHSAGRKIHSGMIDAADRRREHALAASGTQSGSAVTPEEAPAPPPIHAPAGAPPRSDFAEPSAAAAAARSAAPSAIGLRILALAKTAGRRSAAPISAIVAATVVYLVGTHWVGADARIALSRSAGAPEVPNLGTLEEPAGRSLSPDSDRTGNSPGKQATAQRSGGSSTVVAQPSQGAIQMVVEEAPMPDGLSWPGKGLIEVVTSKDELIYVDHVFTGRGPLRRIPVSSGTHEIAVQSADDIHRGQLEVTVDKCTRAVFRTPL